MTRIRFAPLSLALACLLTPLTFGADPDRHAPVPTEPLPAETLTAEPLLRDAAGSPAQENARLRAEVELLKSRVSMLEARVRSLEAAKAPAPKPAPRLTPPQPTPRPAPRAVPKAPESAPRRGVPMNPVDPRPVPEGWQEREFNGIRYYIVPLQPAEAKATPASPGAAAPKHAAEAGPVQK